jgi:opacity protein-like surface antigen
MKQIILLAGTLLCLAASGVAQEVPRMEAFAGYSYLRTNVDTTFLGGTGTQGVNFNGGSGELAFNVTNWLGAVADFGGYTTNSNFTVNGLPVTANTNIFSYMFGPRISFGGNSRLRPYSQILFGGARIADALTTSGSENAFAMALGGGVDFNATRRFAIRPIQAEYFMTKFSDGNNNRQNNLLISTGIVFRFGS